MMPGPGLAANSSKFFGIPLWSSPQTRTALFNAAKSMAALTFAPPGDVTTGVDVSGFGLLGAGGG